VHFFVIPKLHNVSSYFDTIVMHAGSMYVYVMYEKLALNLLVD